MFQMPMRCAASTQLCAMHMRRSIGGMWTGWGSVSGPPPIPERPALFTSVNNCPVFPCAAVPSHPTMCVSMREERNADSSTPHFKLGFLNLTKRAAKDRGKTTTVGGTDGGQVVDQREGQRAGGLVAGRGVGNLALCESALGSGACDWPRLAMVAGAASTKCH